jgi:pimeloyl-ACP methyl ester carboxylesterase
MRSAAPGPVWRFAVVISGVALTASLTSLSPQSSAVPRFERGSCPVASASVGTRLECGSLVVPRDRRQSNGRTFRLAVAISKPQKPATNLPILFLAGGPSGVGGIRSGVLAGFARTGFNREVVVLDYRGQGLSEPALDEICAGLTVEACIPRLQAQGVDHATFNSAVNADDVRDLRRTLGYERWDVVGESYGSRLAQEVMRRDAQGVRVAVLIAPVPVGPHLEVEMPRTFQHVIERVFSSCAAQPACAAAYPTLEADFYAVHDALEAKPIVVSIPAEAGARSVVFDGRTFVRMLRRRFAEVVAEVPLIVHELARGDRIGVVRRLVRDGGPAYPNNTLTNLVGCYDRFTPETRTLGASVAAQVKPPFRQFQAQSAECEYRRSLPPDAGYDDLVTTDIPTLIFANEFDDRTPLELGRRIAARLTHAHVVEIPGVHGEAPINECGFAIAGRFFANPLDALDTSCLASMPAMRFALPESGPVTLTFTIASDRPSPFAGRWQAAFSAGGQYAFDLTIDGEAITGTIRSASATTPIQEGRASASEIRFSVRSPNGERIISFTGILDGDRILFTREVRIRPGGAPGGAALFGAASGHWFTAVRAGQGR